MKATYANVSALLGTVSGVIVFGNVWGYTMLAYGLWGFVLGWLPALVLGGITALLITLLWPLLLVLALGWSLTARPLALHSSCP